MPLTKKLDLIDGFRKFRRRYFILDKDLYLNLSTKGQSPKTLLIACSDSRVDPAILLSSEPGDLFVIRNVANLVPPYEEGGGHHGTSAAIEFAVNNLKVEDIVVLGHAQCGGVAALAAGQAAEGGSFISKWVNIAADARIAALKKESPDNFKQFCHECELEAIKVSIKNLKTFPFIQKRLDEGSLTVSGWYFDLEVGKMWEYSEKGDSYIEL
ncbi:carbonic anhydrase [Bdellovibrio sp. HCB337]|uniref:carbonic anhydrase n=1 Tax=Bdellovibrio sp. HCB337 TaxID=3394358 RepID=UPI0039A59937